MILSKIYNILCIIFICYKAICKRNVYKNWHAFWYIGTPSSKIGTPLGKLACQVETIARRIAHEHNHWQLGTYK